MGKGGTWLTSRGYPPPTGQQVLPNVERSSSSSILGGASKNQGNHPQSAQSTRPHTSQAAIEDPRKKFDTSQVRFYSFESPPVSRSAGSTGMLDALLNKEGDAYTGRRKKEECLKSAHMERLVVMDGFPQVGDRVVISSRGRDVRRPGSQCVGTIERVEGQMHCVVTWDDGSGPYWYATNAKDGYQLAFVQPEDEAQYDVRRQPEVYWSFARSDAASVDAVHGVCGALDKQGYDASTQAQISGGNTMGVDIPHARLCVVCLTPGFVSNFARCGPCKEELQYALQTREPEGLLVLKLDERVSLSAFGLLSAPLSKAKCIDLSRGVTGRELQLLLEWVAGKAK
mmetsp:Transcript_24869/g.61073  ORF Transcript_24869/g.61073 Transcript_24869/m.61073 type:complete len:341 (+) Transcript_24869:175-1197(+)